MITTMNLRLQRFLELEQLSPARLADILGIQRSGISHILAGRNKPGYDFFYKMNKKFPTLNIEWLISGAGKIYKELLPLPKQSYPEPIEDNPAERNLFSDSSSDGNQPEEYEVPDIIQPENSTPQCVNKSLTKIIFVYSDGTFDIFNPA